MTVTLRPYQQKNIGEIRAAFAGKPLAEVIHRAGHSGPADSVLYVLPTGGGKCLGHGTPVMKYDGTVVPVESIAIGDLLMGPDSGPRKVVSLARGSEMLYRITPVKGDPYVVNESHILSLKRTGVSSSPKYPSQKRTGEIVNITVQDYLSKSKTWKHIHKGWRAPVDFKGEKKLPLPPYILGAWLGDGTTGFCSMTTAENEIADEFRKYAKSCGMEFRVVQNSDWSVVFHMQGANGRRYGRGGSPFGNALRQLDVFRDKHVPHCYLTASRSDRLQLLAGIIDTDGYYSGKGFQLTLKSEKLIDGVIFVARSLGFAAYKSKVSKKCHNNGVVGEYFSCTISGDIDQVPCRLHRKQAKPRQQKKNPLVTGITVEPIGVGDYYGFELEGPDRLFLLGDFTVTHNTFTFVYIAEQAAARGNRVLIVAHRKELIRQASLSLAALGVEHQVVAPADKVVAIRRAHIEKFNRPFIRTGATVAVGSVQTIPRRAGWLQQFNPALLIVDEAHHSVAGQWRTIIEALPDSRILGVTATPCRTDGQGLGDIYEAMVLGPSMRELIEMGSLCLPRIFCPPTSIDMSGVHMRGGDYNAQDLAAALDKPTITGDAVEHYRKLSPGRPAIVFCSSINHARHVCAQFVADGWRFDVVTGEMDDGDRDRAISGLAAGRIHGIVTVDVVSEGTDIPVAEVAILLRPTQSESLYLQQVGRVLRPAPGKEYGLILDHVGNVKEHGLPHADREWSLDAEKRSRRGKSETGPRVLICPECYIPHEPAPECPGCGYKYETQVRKIEQAEGELVELQPDEAELLRMEQRRAQWRARDLASLKAAGMSESRAMHVLAARAEKERLQGELMTLARDHAERFGRGSLGFTAADIKAMKPKQLRFEIERVSGRLFGVA